MEKLSWTERLSENLDRTVGQEVRIDIMSGGESLSSGSAPGKKARWVCGMLARLEQRMDEAARDQVMAECHCAFHQPTIRKLKTIYEQTHQINPVVEALRTIRQEELHRRLNDDPVLWEKTQQEPFYTILVRDGSKLIHIGPPYHPWKYLVETDLIKRRAEYCHCGWINGSQRYISQTFCYCGAGYYQSLWEGVLDLPVTVKVLNSVFNGDSDCRFEVTLPAGIG